MAKKKEAAAVRTSPTPEEVWAYLQETGRLMREWSAAADQRNAETEKQIAELRKETTETEKQSAETGKEIRIGLLVSCGDMLIGNLKCLTGNLA